MRRQSITAPSATTKLTRVALHIAKRTECPRDTGDFAALLLVIKTMRQASALSAREERAA